jgi:hypothetical protein
LGAYNEKCILLNQAKKEIERYANAEIEKDKWLIEYRSQILELTSKNINYIENVRVLKNQIALLAEINVRMIGDIEIMWGLLNDDQLELLNK